MGEVHRTLPNRCAGSDVVQLSSGGAPPAIALNGHGPGKKNPSISQEKGAVMPVGRRCRSRGTGTSTARGLDRKASGFGSKTSRDFPEKPSSPGPQQDHPIGHQLGWMVLANTLHLP